MNIHEHTKPSLTQVVSQIQNHRIFPTLGSFKTSLKESLYPLPPVPTEKDRPSREISSKKYPSKGSQGPKGTSVEDPFYNLGDTLW